MESTYLKNYDGPALRIMEVCGTHTAAIFKSGIRSFLSPKIRLVSGPGCPVCVTVSSYIDHCIEICFTQGHELVCFGDLLKVPGAVRTLSDAKGAGGRVRMVWSPFDALTLAERDPKTKFVIAAIGFETTAPAFGLLLEEAEARGIGNIKLLTSLKSALAAIDWICESGEAIDAFICPGHVSVITGSDAYIPLAEKYGKPFIVAGFEAEHLLKAIKAATEDASEGRGGMRNLYTEAVSEKGNQKALDMIDKYFKLDNAEWRGLGTVAGSGYYLDEEYRAYDMDCFVAANAAPRNDKAQDNGQDNGDLQTIWDVPCVLRDEDNKTQGKTQGTSHIVCKTQGTSHIVCKCGDVILGRIDPDECHLFGKECTPIKPVGPCMVSAEGACGTWYSNRGN